MKMFAKALALSLIYGAIVIFILRSGLFQTENLPKLFVGWAGVIFVMGLSTWQNLRRFKWEEIFSAYVNKFNLTPDVLARLTNRSLYDFVTTKDGTVKIFAKSQKERTEILRQLEKQFGPLK
ncbi:hypothetical protein [Enterococcus timonensis]|uniref:hypothetical protein n=1 Tax=Enterococcus timonensis TaxID=1852364 RepID=UPI0008DA9360|nr:hypothetical protein [Enterococcus timonensis]